MIKELEKKLKDIPEEFAEAAYDDDHIEKGSNEERENNNDKKDYEDMIKNYSPEEEAEWWECGYYRGYEVCLNDLKHRLNQQLIDDLKVRIVSDLVIAGIIKDCTDTDDDTEFEAQDIIFNNLMKTLGIKKTY